MLILDSKFALGFTGGPNYATSRIRLSGGKERRNRTWALPRRLYEFDYTWRPVDECWEIEDFFHDVNGSADTWLLTDYTLRQGARHILGTGTGAQTQFQARIGYGSTSIRYVDCVYIVSGSLKVYVNGSQVSVSSETDGLITLTAAPANGTTVTAEFIPRIPVRFDQDGIKVEPSAESVGLARITGLTASEVR